MRPSRRRCVCRARTGSFPSQLDLRAQCVQCSTAAVSEFLMSLINHGSHDCRNESRDIFFFFLCVRRRTL
jgi:hypothetical protein